ncbi:dipeptidase [Acidobacteria bacterium ACD]|nr:MAG: dipeptidase [Acidobacteriota bacterium]MCE7957317.1 dipeptidase [Acidobacteria bacterium ACB2]MDL1949915.1 dipeptidase [Acidobacteria bacterium ACD]
MRRTLLPIALSAVVLLGSRPAPGCTSLLVTKGASADGSTFITYAADSHDLYGELYFTPAGVHPFGAMRDVVEWDTNKTLGRIPQVPVTYQVVGNMNEHQVAIAESTWGGRKELKGPSGIVDYGSLIWIALERSKTAREAIDVMTKLAEEHGYASTGESFSIADPNEAWILEMIGKGEKQKGALWVAVRVPDGTISGHANQPRIRRFPRNDPKNVLFAPDVVSFAREKGWFTGKDEEFSFADVYSPLRGSTLRGCDSRVWSVFRRAAPSLNLSSDWVLAVPGAEPLPFSVKPDRKLSVKDVMELMRDHFEGTELDMTKDVGAGPFKLPYRWRPMGFKVDGVDYVNERAISTQQTGYSIVAQLRSFLPAQIGGVLWFGLDDTYSTVYTPMYAGIREVPRSYAVGTADFSRFSWDSAFWVFNFVTNWAYSRYSDMIVDVRKAQGEIEGRFLAEQPEVEKAALVLHAESPAAARDYLTAYSVRAGDGTVERWKKLGEFLLWKYIDGNVRDSQGNVTHPRYPQDWYDRIAKDGGDRLKQRKLPSEGAEEH